MAKRWTHSDEALDYYSRGYLAQEQGRPTSQLEACFRKAVSADPNCARAWAALGSVLATQGRFDLAEDAVQKAVQLDPGAPHGHAALGWVYAAQRRFDQAKTRFRRACQLDPDDADYLTVLAEIFAQEGKWDEATAFLETAVLLDRTNARTHAALAKAYAITQRPDEAARELKEASHHLSEGIYAANALWPMAEVYERLGNRSEALASYERTLALAQGLAVRPEMIRAVEERIQRIKNALHPTFINASMPERYTEADLDAVLRDSLTEAERELIEHPFKCTEAMKQWAQELAAGAATDLDRAKAIFDALADRLRVLGQPRSRTAREVFEAWNRPETRLVCMDLAVLFTALARAADVDTFFVHVTKVADGTVLNHACAAVFAGHRALLVDPSLRWFGVPHQQYSILNDREATAFLCFNNRGGDPKAVPVCHAGLKLWPDSAQRL
jgi:tetratricopeptide (TPR) repeat protein